jgi:DNA-binding CsgD family transcriptional regulator
MEDRTAALADVPGCLSERELEVLKLLATGATNQQIARSLFISPNTVKVHLRNIYEKLGVQSRTEATMESVRRGWVTVVRTPVVAEEERAGAPAADAPAAEAASSPIPLPVLRQPIRLWQRIYMLVAGLLVVVAVWAPELWQSRSQALALTPLSDVGQLQVAPGARAKVTRWSARSPLPDGRSRLAVAEVAGEFYAIGGETAGGILDQVTVYNPQSNDWLGGARKPTAVANVSAAVLNGLIYVPGGTISDGQATAALEVYNPISDTWQSRAPLPAPVAAYGLAALNGRLYLFGGWDGTRYVATTYVYDPATDKWRAGTPLPAPRAFLAAYALEQQIYVAGGYDGHVESNSVLAYDPNGEGTSAGPWAVRATLNQGRGGLALVGIYGRLFAIGGGWRNPISFNEQYDLRTGAWSKIESPVTGQWRNLGLVARGNDLYAIGGWSGAYLANVERYTALYQIMLPISAGQSK